MLGRIEDAATLLDRIAATCNHAHHAAGEATAFEDGGSWPMVQTFARTYVRRL